MEKELLQILKSNKKDNNLISDTIELVKEKNNFDRDLSCKIIEGDSKVYSELGCVAYFNPADNEIVVYPDEFKKLESQMYKNYQHLNMMDNIEQGRKLMIMQYILHELEHVYQNEISKDKSDNSDYAKLSRLCFEQDNINYILNYGFAPTERIAQINSYKILSEMLKDSEYRNLYWYYIADKMAHELSGYKASKAPLMDFLYFIKKVNIVYDLEIFKRDIKNVTLEDKLFYGLLIEKYEMKEQKRKIEKILRKIK